MSTENGFGVILSINDLQAKLRTISIGPRQWNAKLVNVGPCDECLTNAYAEIWYSNPGLTGMPNELCFRFPVFCDLFGDDAESLVCLHPSLIVPVQEGLVF